MALVSISHYDLLQGDILYLLNQAFDNLEFHSYVIDKFGGFYVFFMDIPGYGHYDKALVKIYLDNKGLPILIVDNAPLEVSLN